MLLEVLLLLVPVIGILCGNKTISTLADAQVTTEEGVIREAKVIPWTVAAISAVPGWK